MPCIIYRLFCTTTKRSYIGSTKSPLEIRLAVHKCHYNKWLRNELHTYYYSFIIFENNTVEAIIVETVEDESQRYNRERWFIENTENCVNYNIPGRKPAEYHLDNREYHNKQMLEIYYRKSDEINKKLHEKYKNNVNGYRDKIIERINYNKIQKLIEYELDN